jgi:hypothetical protein
MSEIDRLTVFGFAEGEFSLLKGHTCPLILLVEKFNELLSCSTNLTSIFVALSRYIAYRSL